MTEKYKEKKAIEAVCFTGHRHIERNKALLIPTKLKEVLEALISRGAVRFRAGGAWGFDTVAALCVIELQVNHPEISLELVLPCRDQTKLWNEESRDVYEYILSKATHVEYASDHFTSWCMHERNRRLVNESQVCVAYLAHSGGGTAYTYGYALKKELEVINIHDLI